MPVWNNKTHTISSHGDDTSPRTRHTLALGNTTALCLSPPLTIRGPLSRDCRVQLLHSPPADPPPFPCPLSHRRRPTDPWVADNAVHRRRVCAACSARSLRQKSPVITIDAVAPASLDISTGQDACSQQQHSPRPSRLASRDIHVNANYVSDLCCPLALAPLPDSPGSTCPPSDRQVSPASRPRPWSHIQALSATDCPTSTTTANSRRVRARFVSAPCRQPITLVHTGAIKGQQLPLQP